MNELTDRNFGLLIAYLLPGYLAVWGASEFSPVLRGWLSVTPPNAPTLGGFLYVTVGSVGAGLTVSTVRWVIIDTLHHWTGVRQPRWDFSRLQANISAFGVLIDIHYRYYQFYSNALISLAFVYAARRLSLGFLTLPIGWTDLGFLALGVIFFAGSRDTLRKYYARVAESLGTRRSTHRRGVAPTETSTHEEAE